MHLIKRAALAALALACAASPALAQNARLASSTVGAATASASFTPGARIPFHVLLTGTAVLGCQLERQLDGATWSPMTVTAGGSTTVLYNWSYSGTTLSEDVTESQEAVPYRVNCTSYTSGTLTVKFSQ